MQIEIPEAFGELFTPKRYKVFHGGRGGAKSESFARALLAQAMSERMGVLCAREIQKSIKDSVHRLLKEIILGTPELNSFFKATETEIKGRNGSFFIFMGLKHNIQEIKSLKGIKRCWVEEAQAVSHNSWETLIPTIREEDSEIWISFNEKNATDPTWMRFVLDKDEDMLVRKVSYRDNPYFPAVLEKERLKLKRKDPEAYEHVWEGGFDTRHSGKVYAKFIKADQFVDECVYDLSLPIYTAWDLGYDDATSIVWFQLAPGEIRVVDYYECNFQDPLHYCEQLYGCKLKVLERENRTGRILRWEFGERLDEDRSGYVYTGARHYAPHDAANKLMAAGGRSIVEQCAELGIVLETIPATTHQNCEAALRGCLDRVWFNKTKCKDAVHALMSYHYEYDEDLNIFSKEPIHDWSSHCADAMELMARMWQDTGKSVDDMARVEYHEKFRSLRSQAGLDDRDPYRIRKKQDKRYAGRRPGGRLR